MSGTVSTLPGLPGLLGVLVQDSTGVRQTLDTLTTQAGDGLVAQTYAGLAAGGQVSLTVAPALAHSTTWQANIDAAQGRLQVTQTALTQISAIASDFAAKTNTLNGLNASDVDSVAADARDALKQVAALLNSRDGDVYVFAGQDSANPPVPSGDAIGTSGFATQIAAAVGQLGTVGAAGTAATTLAVAGSNAAGTTPFSAGLSGAGGGTRPTIQTGAGSRAVVGLLANANGEAASAGNSTTGSYARDVLRALATLGALSSGQLADSGFAGLVADVRDSLNGAVSALNVDAGVLGDRTAVLAATKATLASTDTALQAQVSATQEVDMTATLSALTRTQSQLQASYQLIAGLQSLSLTKFLSA